MKLLNHFLEHENVERINTPNVGGPFSHGLPDTILLHYTSGPSLDVAVKYLIDRKYNVSAHLVIGKKGEVVQLAPFNIVTFHAGKSVYGERENLNDYSIGIEIDNPGLLQNEGGVVKAWFGKEIKDENFIVSEKNGEKQFWHKFTDVQLKRVEEICRFLKREYQIKHLLGHFEVGMGNIDDPGPAFPLEKLREKLGFFN